MKIVEINSVCGTGSTGVIAVEIAEFLRKRGHECYIAYGHGHSDYPYSFKFGSKIETKFHAMYNTRILGLESYGSPHGTNKLIKWISEISPDIIHLHNLHGNYLNFPMLMKYLAEVRIPIVWSMFDTWAITGKCTHFTASGCTKWQNECNNCPQLHSSGAKTYFFDRTNKIFRDKVELIASIPKLDIISCSKWLKGELEKSHLKNRPIHMIYNWIDQEKFGPIIDETIYHKYGIDRKKKILLSVSAYWSKHTTRFEDASRLANILPKEYQLVIIGKCDVVDFPSNIKHIPFVKGTYELSKLYSAALAFVGFSIEDTFGKVFAEAMLCGTPCVVFDSTACPEVIGQCGYAVTPHDVRAMLNKVEEINRLGKAHFSKECIARVKNLFCYDKNVGEYLKIYEQIITKQN